MKHTQQLTLFAGLLAVSTLASADITNGPNPYAAGFGFDTPAEAAWGGWNRGDAGTIYAEWDTFVDNSYAGTRTAAPDIGQSGAGNVNLSWNAGTFAAGSGNLYSFSVPETFTASLTATAGSEPVRAVLQFETWGVQMDYSAILLNGLAPTYSAQTFYDAAYASSFGAVELVQHLVYWDLEQAAAQYLFSFGSAEHSMSLAQVAVDIGPAPVPLPTAAWLLGSGLLGLTGLSRRSRPA